MFPGPLGKHWDTNGFGIPRADMTQLRTAKTREVSMGLTRTVFLVVMAVFIGVLSFIAGAQQKEMQLPHAAVEIDT